MRTPPTRREFLRQSTSSILGTLASGGCVIDAGEGELNDDPFPIPEARAITSGPLHHWFGYYDKLEFDPDNRFVLGMEVGFEGRKPVADDVIKVGMVDIRDGDRWIELGESTAWSWQQGCMLQWIPSTSSQVIWNDRENGAYVSRILDTQDTGAGVRTLPMPIFCLTPDGRTAFTIDFARIQTVRAGYGYPGIPDPFDAVLAPSDSGIWRMDLATGETSLIFSIAQAAALQPHWEASAKHWLYHLLVSTDGTRLAFLHCNLAPGGSIYCRMITTNLDGTQPYVLDDFGKTSHYDWRDGTHLLAWTLQDEGYGFWLFEDQTPNKELIGPSKMVENGHCTYLPQDRDLILNDTYPDADGNQHPFLFDAASGLRQSLGQFNSPDAYRGEFRCDTHPRASRDGRSVVVDSPHDGGRQMYLIDVGEIVDGLG
jgi:hypothetical protein